MNRNDLLNKLVCTGHLNVPERKALGTVTLDEIVHAIETRLEADGIFPPNARPGTPGSCIYEGPQLRRQSDGSYLGLNQRASVHNPSVVVQQGSVAFKNLAAAIDWYIDAEWGDEIDGIPIG